MLFDGKERFRLICPSGQRCCCHDQRSVAFYLCPLDSTLLAGVPCSPCSCDNQSCHEMTVRCTPHSAYGLRLLSCSRLRQALALRAEAAGRPENPSDEGRAEGRLTRSLKLQSYFCSCPTVDQRQELLHVYHGNAKSGHDAPRMRSLQRHLRQYEALQWMQK